MRIRPLRPLMVLCILYCTGLAALFALSVFSYVKYIVVGAAVVICLLFAVLPYLLLKRLFCVAAAGICVLACLQVDMTLDNYRAFQRLQPETVEVIGRIETLYYATDNSASFLLDVEILNGEPVDGKLYMESYGSRVSYADPGDTIRCTAVLGDAELSAEYLDDQSYHFSDGIYGSAYVTEDGVFEVIGDASGFSALCQNLAASCRQRLYRFLPAEDADFINCLLLGDKSTLAPEIKRDFRRVGLSHVLAVSGIHVSILIGGMQKVLSLLRVRKQYQLVLLLLFLLVFMGMTGFSPSVIRAGIMWMLYCCAYFLGGRQDSLTALFLAATVICLLTPEAVFDIGLLLSAAATLGILLLSEPQDRYLQQKWRGKRWLYLPLSLCGLTFSATIFTLPVTLFLFGEFSVISPLANLLMHIPVTILMYASPILLLLSLLPQAAFVPAVCGIVGDLISGTVSLLTGMTAWLSTAGTPLVGVRYPFLLPVFLLFIVLTVVWMLMSKRILVIYPSFLLCCMVFFCCLQIYTHMTANCAAVTYQVQKKNDILTIAADGKGMLIDASNASYAAAKCAWEQLSQENITELDAYLITHYHTKHPVTLQKLADTVVFRRLLLPYPVTDEEWTVYEDLCSFAEQNKIAVMTYQRGTDTIAFGVVSLSVFPYTVIKRSVQPLLGLSLEVGEDSVVYLGSAAWDTAVDTVYQTTRDAALAESDVLLCGTHGPLVKTAFGDAAVSLRAEPFACITYANAEIASYASDVLTMTANAVYQMDQMDNIRLVLNGK